MSNINIETLTPVHIGSGNSYQQNTDFVIEGKKIGIIDEKKILTLIGESNLSKWVKSIEDKENTRNYLQKIIPLAKLSDYSKRTLNVCADNVSGTDTLKECIHDGNGLPYIPGSSIKGAIRTAILSSLVHKVDNLENKIYNKRNYVSAETIEKKLFGNEPNSDLFRFIKVGDAYFNRGAEIALKMVNLNIRNRASFWDTSKPQLLEAIGEEEKSIFRLNLDTNNYNFSKGHGNSSLPDFYEETSSVTNLFQTINTHTRYLVDKEIKIWEDHSNEKNVDVYIEQIQSILEAIDSCKSGKSCVLRIGHASGWRFITGAWTEHLNNFNNTIVPSCRPRNDRYQDYIFPKSRRVDDGAYLIGFVKLTVLD